MSPRSIQFVFQALLLLTGFFVSAQTQKSKTQLQKEKQQNLEKIKETEKILSETSQQKKSTMGELAALTQRIHQQETLKKR
jgi:outer membrane lipoprotein-sorting protein